jgi:hypothetical protein
MVTSFIGTVVTMVLSLFKMLIYVLGFIAQGFTYLFTCIAFLPTFVQAFAIVVIAYSVIITVLNKGE